MIPVHMEPIGLAPDAEPIADFFCDANWRYKAVIGSRKMRRALDKLGAPPPPKPRASRPSTWPARQAAKLNVLKIRCLVAEHFGRPVTEMLSRRGRGTICIHRQIAMYLSRHCTTASYADIGKWFGGRDHTTVIHACNKVEKAIQYDLRVWNDVDHLRRMIAG